MDRETGEQQPDDQRLRRRRLRMAGERLTEDTSLRDALRDEQAGRLLDWGMTHIKAEVENTLELDEEPAGQALDACVTEVRRVMQQVNQMVEQWESADPAGRWQDLLELSQALRPMQAQPAEAVESTQEIFVLGQSEIPMDKEALFTQLMDILETKP